MSKKKKLNLTFENVTSCCWKCEVLARLIDCGECDMGWLRLVGSLKLQVSFAKEPYQQDDILQKETYHFKEPTDRSHPIL